MSRSHLEWYLRPGIERKKYHVGQTVLLVTRKLPMQSKPGHARLRRYLEHKRRTITRRRPNRTSKGVDAILTCSTELFSAEVIEEFGTIRQSGRDLSVGYEHIDTAAAKKQALSQPTRRCPDRCNSRPTILLMLGATRRARIGSKTSQW